MAKILKQKYKVSVSVSMFMYVYIWAVNVWYSVPLDGINKINLQKSSI